MNHRNNLEDVLVSVASEFTGQSQACRNELYYFFDIFIGWADSSLRTNVKIEEHDLILRNKARRIYLEKLEENGVEVSYKDSTVTVKWGRFQSTRVMQKEGRSAARTAYVSLIKKRMDKKELEFNRWPLFSRPLQEKLSKLKNQEMDSREILRDCIALIFVTDNEIRNKHIWNKWLENAPRQDYRIYTKYDKDKYEIETIGKSITIQQKPESIDAIIELLYVALQEPNNKFFVILNDACIPMTAFSTFYENVSRINFSVFEVYSDQIQKTLCNILEDTGKHLGPENEFLREVIEHQDFHAHSDFGTILVRNDCEALMYEATNDENKKNWSQVFDYGPLRQALFPKEITANNSNGAVYNKKNSFFLSPQQLFIMTYLKHHYRKKYEILTFHSKKIVHYRCCLEMGNCLCAYSRPIIPADYYAFTTDFVNVCIQEKSLFGGNFHEMAGAKLSDLQLLWSYDQIPENKIIVAAQICKNWFSPNDIISRGPILNKSPKILLDVDDIKNIDCFEMFCTHMITGISIKNTMIQKLYLIFQFLRGPDAPAILHHCEDDYTHTNCVLGFCRIEVQQPLFYQKIDKLIGDSNLWRCKDVKNMYTILRQIGVRPKKHSRGPKEGEPMKPNFMYATTFYFCPMSLERNKHGLSTGYRKKPCTRNVNSSMSFLPFFDDEYDNMTKFYSKNNSNIETFANDISHTIGPPCDQIHESIQSVHLIEKQNNNESVPSGSGNSAYAFESIQEDLMQKCNGITKVSPVIEFCKDDEAVISSTVSLDTTGAVDALLSLSNPTRFVEDITLSKKKSHFSCEIENNTKICGVEVLDNISSAEKNGIINVNSSNRLKALYLFIEKCLVEGLVSVEKKIDPSLECILGWSSLHVSNPRILNDRIKKMVDDDHGGIWKKANGKMNQTLKNPTLGVYELFRKIGVKPKGRGPILMDPGASDMFYHNEWKFINDKSFQDAKARLIPGYKFNLDQASREKRHTPNTEAKRQKISPSRFDDVLEKY